MVTKGIDPWQSALLYVIQRLRLKATIACFGAVLKLLFGERNNPSLKVTKSLIPFVFLSCFGVTRLVSFKYFSRFATHL